MWEIEQLKIQIQKFKNLAKIKIQHFEFEEKVSKSFNINWNFFSKTFYNIGHAI